MKHVNIPIFIPHLGCPNNCVFCNQRTISGTVEFDIEKVNDIIRGVIDTSARCEREIAFFGGSFTGIDRGLMIKLLDTAQTYVASGEVSGIRMSTRPDYIDDGIIGILKKYTVSQVELGIQSTCDRVLSASGRGHDAKCALEAIRKLKSAGFSVVGQMMIGLPRSTPEDEIKTADDLAEAGCDGARIYPTVVFKGTELDRMRERFEYVPLTLDDAVARSASALEVFVKAGIPCLRVGLCESENLHSEETYSAGPNHAALGELVMSRLYYNRLSSAFEGRDVRGRDVTVLCPRGATSKVVGNGGENRRKLQKEFGIKSVKTIEKDDLISYNIKVLFN